MAEIKEPMFHIMVISILIYLITGSVSLSLCFIVDSREKNPLFRHHIIIMILITVNLVITQTAYYFITLKIFAYQMPFLRLLSCLDGCFIVYWCILVEYPAGLKRRLIITDRIFKTLGILAGLSAIVFFIFFTNSLFLVRNIIFILLLSGLIIDMIIVFSGNSSYDHKGKYDWNLYTKIIILLYVVILPALFIVMFNKNDVKESVPYYFLVYPFGYFLIHFFSTVFLARVLIKPSYRIETAAYGQTGGNDFNFSEREKEIAEKLIRGISYREIGQSLGISPETVKSHIKNIYRKAGINKRYELVGIFRKKAC